MKTLLLMGAFVLFFSNVVSQEVVVSGIVSDENNQPFPNAMVIIKGTETKTFTNEEGAYTIMAELGQNIDFCHIGYFTLTVKIENEQPIHIEMRRDDAAIITALTGGFVRKKAQGYAVSTIPGSEIAESTQNDFSITLQGKVAGIAVKPQTSFVGSTNSVVIRGVNTFNGSNHPLYVIDGVPYDTSINRLGNIYCGDLGSNRSFDIDPNNIESVKVLKGLAATNIYGSEGRNGVVLITTKVGPYANK